jgi:REP element-mobilizing transposase RayT
VRIYQRNLPHWRQEGCTYFVTFRLADSIPNGVRAQWEHEQGLWLKKHGIEYDGESGHWHRAFEKLPRDEQVRFHKHFNRQVQSCLDRGLGACFLRDARCVETVRSKMFNSDGAGWHVGDFVIMPNHIHLLITPATGEALEQILKSIKGSSAVECNRSLNRSGTFWQADSCDHIVRSLEELHAYREYIASNPGQAKIVLSAEAQYRAEWIDQWFQA